MTKTLVEYVWIGGKNELRCKTMVLSKEISVCDNLPIWNYDGSSTAQASGEDSEVIIKPCALFNDPFRKGNHKIVLCDTYTPKGEPLDNNNRIWAKKIFDQVYEEQNEHKVYKGRTCKIPSEFKQFHFGH